MAKKKRSQQVRFIRKNGKIIPIRSGRGKSRKKKSKTAKQASVGAATSAAGVGIALAGGKTTRKASDLAQRAGRKAGRARTAAAKIEHRLLKRDTKNLSFQALVGNQAKARRFRKSASRLQKAAVGFEKVAARSRAFSLAFGASLLGAGIENIIEAGDPKKNIGTEVAKDFSINLASGLTAAAFILGSRKDGIRKGSKAVLEKLKTSIKGSNQLSFRL